MHHPATTRIVAPVTDANPHGFVIINEADLTDDHELFDDSPAPEPAPTPAKASRKA